MNNYIAKTYTYVNNNKPNEYWDFEKYQIKWNSTEPYELVKKIGRGKYSDVFLAVDVVQGKHVVLKILKPVRSKKIKREIKILTNLRGGPNVINLIDTIIHSDFEYPTLVMDYMPTTDFSKIFGSFNLDDIRHYIMELLKVLDFSHSMGIMHRDVKPQNVLFNHKERKIVLIDWGLAEFYHAGTAYNVRVASKCYKGPELLINFQKYDYSLDLWSLGCMLASMLFLQEPFFHGKDDLDQLYQIARVLGYSDLATYAESVECKVSDRIRSYISGCVKKPWESFVSEKNQHLYDSKAIDLLEHLLVYDHRQRFTAKEAMGHPFFVSFQNGTYS